MREDKSVRCLLYLDNWQRHRAVRSETSGRQLCPLGLHFRQTSFWITPRRLFTLCFILPPHACCIALPTNLRPSHVAFGFDAISQASICHNTKQSNPNQPNPEQPHPTQPNSMHLMSLGVGACTYQNGLITNKFIVVCLTTTHSLAQPTYITNLRSSPTSSRLYSSRRCDNMFVSRSPLLPPTPPLPPLLVLLVVPAPTPVLLAPLALLLPSCTPTALTPPQATTT